MIENDVLILGGRTFTSRLITGSGKFADESLIPQMITSSGSQMITIALRRVDFSLPEKNILQHIPPEVTLLPNTSGARNAAEAVRIARIARDGGLGNFVKIEIITDHRFLMPDNYETLKACEILAKEDFIVLPYISPDPMTARHLESAGAAAVMPLGSPIGSNRGIKTAEMIRIIQELVEIPVIVDAGIGRPSQAAEAMEMGVDAVLVNTAISTAADPVTTARAFALAVEAGRLAWLSRIREESLEAQASSPLTGFLQLDGVTG